MSRTETANDLVALMRTGAALLDFLDDLTGLYVGFHRDFDPGIRVHVNTGQPVTLEPGELDQVALALGAEVEFCEQGGVGVYRAKGAWGRVPAEVVQVSPELDPDEPRSLLSAAQVARCVRLLVPVVQRIDPAALTTALVKDVDGLARCHLVLASDDWHGALDQAAVGFPLSEKRETPHGVYGTFLTPDGLPVTVASIT